MEYFCKNGSKKWSTYKIRWVLRESPIANCTNGPVCTKYVSGEGLRRGRKGRDGNGTDKNGVVEFSSALERDISEGCKEFKEYARYLARLCESFLKLESGCGIIFSEIL